MKTLQHFVTWFSDTFRKQGVFGKIIIVSGIFIILFCLCSIPFALSNSSNPTAKATSIPMDLSSMQTMVYETAIAEFNQKAVTVVPTNMPEPTNTQLSQPVTQNQILIKPGTYLVGTVIQPGIYRGEAGSSFFDSCYWARLKDLSGSLDSILANENSIGQFYIEIRSSDYAIETRCELLPLDSIPAITGDFPQIINPGTYLVGRDIQPGIYKGQTGSDITTSCYWARLSNVSGDFGSIIANDNGIGQYYVQVTGSDFALNTACELQRVGD